MASFKRCVGSMDATAEHISASERKALFATLVASCVILSLLSTALHTALSPLIADLGISLSQGQWVTSGYVLVLAVMTPLTAFLTTRIPTRPLYMMALGCFLTGTLMSALAPSWGFLMVGRVLQASANALIATITQVSIMSMFPADQRGRAMGWFGLAIGAAPLVAPALGGIVVDLGGWRMVFWTAGALCLMSLISAHFVMRDVLDTAPRPFDGVSFLLSLVSFGGLTLGFGNAVALGFAAPLVAASLMLGVLAAVPFVRRQLKSPQAFLKLQILRIPAFRWAMLLSMLLYAATMGASAALPLFMQGHLGFSATVSAFAVLPGAAVAACVNPLSGRLYDKWGAAPLALGGGLLWAASSAVLCVPSAAASISVLVASTCVRSLASACMTMPLMTWGNSAVPPEDMPHASALLTSLRNLSGALGVAFFVSLLDIAGLSLCFGILALCGLAISALSFAAIFHR